MATAKVTPFVVPAQPVPDVRSIPLDPPEPKKTEPRIFEVSGDLLGQS